MHCYNVNELHCLKFNCVTREGFKNNQWLISSLIFNDPTYNQFISTPFTNSNYNDCICTKIFKPVKCNGKTYSNICEAKCDGQVEACCCEFC
jgi:hypothetical protein